jgi:HrpA-like RNA helicase
VVHVAGRQHPVRILHAPKQLDDYLDASLVTIFQIHTEHPPGDILVFLTGQEEIENLATLVSEQDKSNPSTAKLHPHHNVDAIQEVQL